MRRGWGAPESAASSAMGCLGYNLRARMALAVLVRHAIVKRLSGSNHAPGDRRFHRRSQDVFRYAILAASPRRDQYGR
jgi:hypothetical protein